MNSITAFELASTCDAALEGDGSRQLTGLASLETAGPEDVSFLANPKYEPALATTRAGAVFVGLEQAVERDDLVLLRARDPNRAFTRAIERFRPRPPRPPLGVHPSAVVEESARISPEAAIGPLCVVGARSEVGAGAVLHAGCIVGPDVTIGAASELHAGVVLYHGVEIGARCVLHAGCVLGSDGFGFEPTRDGWEKIPQCGTVLVEDDVEIGANCTIDRARFGATRIGRGAKIDNLVHVAHNVTVGPGALLIAQAGIAGSSTIGARAILAGQVGVVGHVTIGDGARVAAQSGVSRDLAGGADYFGSPAIAQKEAFRQLHLVAKLPELAKELKRLAARVAELETDSPDGPAT
ncbi:MAG: UDP-3-O-(3-hydroxymyristoyl)glucosamine N-acyltransferase [Planctomycetota bacterium]